MSSKLLDKSEVKTSSTTVPNTSTDEDDSSNKPSPPTTDGPAFGAFILTVFQEVVVFNVDS